MQKAMTDGKLVPYLPRIIARWCGGSDDEPKRLVFAEED
jgi:hypothetical protein